MATIAWDKVHGKPADIYTPPEDILVRELNPEYEVVVSSPRECDICKYYDKSATPRTAGYDGRTVDGPWANMCGHHFKERGVGLGLGRGQFLIVVVEK